MATDFIMPFVVQQFDSLPGENSYIPEQKPLEKGMLVESITGIFWLVRDLL